jgi:hypothetical protein
MATLRRLALRFDRRWRIVAAVLAGWVVLSVSAAGSDPDTSQWFTLPDLRGVLVIIVGLLAVAGLLLAPFVVRGAQRKRRVRSSPLRAAVLLAVLFVLAPMIFGPKGDDASEEPDTSPPADAAQDPDAGSGRSEPGRTDLVALGVTLVVAGGVLAWTHRRLSPALRNLGDEPAMVDVDVAPAVDRAADLLAMGDDPRRAVLVAYSSLERSLADLGHPRRPADTPSEHLAVALAAFPAIAAAAVELADLYERARFSDHPINGTDRDRALASLQRARRLLASPTRFPR